jgi:hypothetical protein
VPLQSGRADAIDKAAPFLRRLHSDALFLGKAVSRDDRAACAARFHNEARALQTTFDALSDALGAVRPKDADIDRVRDALQGLKTTLDAKGVNNEPHDVARFVIGLIAVDLDALITAIYPTPDVRRT